MPISRNNFLKPYLMKVISAKLKVLFITHQRATEFLNQLKQLERLTIDEHLFDLHDINQTLSLSKLKYLSITVDLKENCLLNLDLTSLKEIELESYLSGINFYLSRYCNTFKNIKL